MHHKTYAIFASVYRDASYGQGSIAQCESCAAQDDDRPRAMLESVPEGIETAEEEPE